MISIKRRSVGDIIANVVIYILLTLIAVIMVIPFIYVIAASFATEAEIQTRPIFFIPDSPTLDAYARIFDMNDMGTRVFHSLLISVCVTAIGTFINLFFTTTMAYGLSRSNLIGKKPLLNMVLFTMVFGGGMTVEGVALGTVIAQWWGFLMACLFYRIWYRRLSKYDYRRHLFAAEPLKQFFSLNKDIFLRTLCLVAVNLFFTAAGSRESTIVLAVNTLLMTLFTIFCQFWDGFAYAAEALSGKYYGARNMGAFREVVRRTMGFGAVVAVVFTLLYIVGGENFLSLLTSDKQVIAASGEYFWWAVLIPLSGMSAFVFDGIFVGITQSKSMLCSTAVASASFFGLFFGLHPFLGNHALWLAFILYLLLRGIVLLVIYRKKLR